MHDSIKLGKGKEYLSETLIRIIEYTATHFKSEEELFTRYNFPNSEKHFQEHSFFVKDVLGFKQDFDKGHVMLTIEAMDYLKNWLINSYIDYKTFFNSNGIK